MPRHVSLLQPRWRRVHAAQWLFHGSLLMAFAVLGAIVLVWPQWVAREGAREALARAAEREWELTQRLETVRLKSGRLRDWMRSERRVLLPEELQAYTDLVREVARRSGAAPASVAVTSLPGRRFRPARFDPGSWDDKAEAEGGEIQPRLLRVTLRGPFAAIYRTLGTLCGQKQLFVPERWEVARTPAHSAGLTATVLGTVFVARPARPEEPPLEGVTVSQAAGGAAG